MSVTFRAKRPIDWAWSHWVTIDNTGHQVEQLRRAGYEIEYQIDPKEKQVSDHEFTIKVDQAQIDISDRYPLERHSFATYRSSALSFKLVGVVDELAIPAVGNIRDYDVDVTVKLTPKFVPGYYRLKSSGERATVMYQARPPWNQQRMVAGVEARKSPDAWERVAVAPKATA